PRSIQREGRSARKKSQRSTFAATVSTETGTTQSSRERRKNLTRLFRDRPLALRKAAGGRQTTPPDAPVHPLAVLVHLLAVPVHLLGVPVHPLDVLVHLPVVLVHLLDEDDLGEEDDWRGVDDESAIRAGAPPEAPQASPGRRESSSG